MTGYLSIPTAGNRRKVLALALPIVVASLSQTVMSLVDIAMVGRLGVAAVAAVGLAGLVTFAMTSFLTSLQTGVQTVAARRKGEGRMDEAAATFRVSLRVAVVAGHLLMVVFLAVVPKLFPLLNSDPLVVEPGVSYLGYRGLSVGLVMMSAVYYGFYNAISQTRIHMVVTLIANTFNVVLNYALIFGRLGLPEMGAPGAGLATALATGLAVVLYTIPVMGHALRTTYPGLWRGPFDAATLKKVLRIALPVSFHDSGVILGFAFFMVIMGRISTLALAASEILLNMIAFSFLPALGFSHAAQTLVSESLGRNDPAAARRLTETATVQCIAFMGSLGVLFLLFPAPLLRLFTPDTALIEAAVPPLRLLGLVQFVDAVGMVHYGALRGAGDVVVPAIAEMGLMWFFLIPMSWYLGVTLGWGLLGGWIAITLQIVAYSTVFLIRFVRGPWQHITV